MHPKLCKRLGLPGVHGHGKALFRTVSLTENTETSKDAALLLSIADICKSEISHGGMNNLWRDDLTLPSLPYLSDEEDEHAKPKLPERRLDSLFSLISPVTADQFYPANRIRAVSLDQSLKAVETAPLTTNNLLTTVAVVSPVCRSPTTRTARAYRRQGSLRFSSLAKKDIVPEDRSFSPHNILKSKRSKPLQGVAPKGFVGKKIGRKKFSWKNYPEVRLFIMHHLVVDVIVNYRYSHILFSCFASTA
jgi:hypothetical protein